MALIMFIFNLVTYFFIKKKYTHAFLCIIAIFSIIFSIYSFVPEARNHFIRFVADTGILKNLSHNHSTSGIRNQKYLDVPEIYLNSVEEDEFPKKLNVTKKGLMIER